MKIADERIEVELLRFAAARVGAIFCPSEVARALAPESWRPLMPEIREVAQRLVTAGTLRCTQRGHRVCPLQARGPIRLSAPEREI